jgi:hypothetical protein
MKKFKIILLFILLCINSFAQESFIWPVSGKKAGEDILYRPNDKIAGEDNYDDLIIFAEENTPVVSPVSGHITGFHYVYHKTYSYIIMFGVPPSSDYQADCNEILKNNPNENHDPKFIFVTIGIKMSDGREIYISGLKPEKIFKTGEKVLQGEIIGKTGYLYYKINKPCIAFSISKNGKGEDPMQPLGLKTTFKKFVKKEVTNLIKEEALEDIKVLIDAMEEGYPGLYDYLSTEEWQKIMVDVKNQVVENMPFKDFLYLLFTSLMHHIKDNHFVVNTSIPIDWNAPHYMPTITFGFLNDSLVITNTELSYGNYYGKRILEVNGIAADSIKQMIKNRIGYIGFTKSYIDFDLFTWTWSTFNNITGNKKSEYLVKFSNDSIFFFPTLKKNKDKNSCSWPYRNSWRNFFSHNTNSLTLSKMEDSIAYIGIHSFYLTEVEIDKIAAFVKQLQDSAYKHIIIDVRNNSGGDERICAKLFSFFAQKPFVIQEYAQVKKKNNFNFFKYCTNYNEEVSDLFTEYEPVPDKEGYFYMNQDTVYPDSDINFKGKLYLIGNERSLSASTLFFFFLHKYRRGVIVVCETGNTYHQMNASKFAQIQLPNSQIEITMPLVKCVFTSHDNSIPYGRGVLPHYPVPVGLEELSWENGDTVLNYTLQLIHDGKYLTEEDTVSISKTISNYKIILCIIIVLCMSALLVLLLIKKQKNENRKKQS